MIHQIFRENTKYFGVCNCCTSSDLKIFKSIRRIRPPEILLTVSNINSKIFSSFIHCSRCGHVRRACCYDQEILSLLYCGYKPTSYRHMSEYTPRARLVESDLKSYFVDPLSLAITTVRDYGGDRGQISRQIFNKTVSTVEVIEYEGNGSTDPVPDQKAHFHASSTLHLALHVFEHLEDPRAFMAMMMKSFAVQDILFIEVPYEVPNTVFSPGHYEHIQFYTEGSLTQLLSTYDLRVTISNCIGYGRSLPCLQLVAVKNNSSFRIKRETSIALYFYKNLVQSSLGFKIVWFLLAILKRCRLFPHICQYA